MKKFWEALQDVELRDLGYEGICLHGIMKGGVRKQYRKDLIVFVVMRDRRSCMWMQR